MRGPGALEPLAPELEHERASEENFGRRKVERKEWLVFGAQKGHTSLAVMGGCEVRVIDLHDAGTTTVRACARARVCVLSLCGGVNGSVVGWALHVVANNCFHFHRRLVKRLV